MLTLSGKRGGGGGAAASGNKDKGARDPEKGTGATPLPLWERMAMRANPA